MKTIKMLKSLTIALFIFSFWGCKKDLVISTSKIQEKSTQSSTKMVLFPGAGLVPASQVHLIEPDNYLSRQNGHILKLEKRTNRIVQDFGKFDQGFINPPNGASQPSGALVRSLKRKTPGAVPSGVNPAWADWALWQDSNNQGQETINTFSTNWIVPSAPSINDGQTIFIYNALQDATENDILQPVLQWGNSSAGGANYNWTVTNVFFMYPTPTAEGFYAYTTPVPVAVGANLQGTMTFDNIQSGTGSYNYTSSFKINNVPASNTLQLEDGVTTSSINQKLYASVAPYIPVLNIADEAIEAYDQHGHPLTVAADYPPDTFVRMTGINITTNSGTSYIPWATGTNNLAAGQQAVVQNYSSPGGEVDLYFHPAAPLISYSTPNVFTQNSTITPLSPSNTGGSVTSYSISPALPTGLTFNTTTGVISGTPQVSSASTGYTVTATNNSGTGRFTLYIAVNANFNVAFDISSNGFGITDFSLWVNGTNVSGPRGVSSTNPIVINDLTNSTNPSTVVMQVSFGYMPTSATLYGSFAPINGVISGSNITFNGSSLANPSTCWIVLN